MWKNLVLVSGIECNCTKILKGTLRSCVLQQCAGMWWECHLLERIKLLEKESG